MTEAENRVSLAKIKKEVRREMSMPTLSLEGKVAVVTGGGTGMGRGIALVFAEAGADVAVASRRLPVLEKVAEEIKALGSRALAVRTDVSKKADVDNMVKRVMEKFGTIDILVNDAGIIYERTLIDTKEDEWDKTLEINLKGCQLCSQAVGRIMVKQKRGNIINITSSDAHAPEPLVSAYAVSKAGLVMFTRILAKELAGYNIRVNSISPGWVKTPMSDEFFKDPVYLKEAEDKIPMGRVGEPEDIADVALFLASDLARYVTGATILVDGGFIL
ncbi:SDR family NAD(P)-dependent oxidoreductase [Chloroflexota bacterium]